MAARQSFGRWVSSGRPTSGPVYDVMKNDKRNYKYAVRRLKRHADEIRLDGLACHVLEGSSSQFWKTVDKLKSSKTSQATSII